MPTDPQRPKPEAEAAAAFNQALVNSLNQATAQLPSRTQDALAERRARALGKQSSHWPWAVAASLLLVLGVLSWHAPAPTPTPWRWRFCKPMTNCSMKST